MTLWIILTALTALAAAWLTIPLVRRHEARVDARAATIAVLKDQLADIGGSKELERLAVNAPINSHYYEGLYHEVFNEPEQATVLHDLTDWLQR